jgi:L-ascorbate metabolism protein UlaG (beta-lactamase superfamily)
MSAAFDAEISNSEKGLSLFFVVAREGTPDAAVLSVGGSVVTRLIDPRRALAVAPLAAHAQLRDHFQLQLAGPVSVDPQRFQHFAELIGLSDSRAP